MDTLNNQLQKKLKGSGFNIMFTLCLVIAITIIGIAIMCFYVFFKQDLSQPITASDKLDISEVGYVLVGDSLYGCPAPLENYIQLFTYRKNDDETIYNWIDEKATARYYLPLYDNGVLKKTFFLTRVSEEVFEANPCPSSFEEYLSAKKQVEDECATRGADIAGFRIIIVTGGTFVILTDTTEGILGVLFNSAPDGSTDGKPQRYPYSENAGIIMNEQELRYMFTVSSK